MFNYQCRIAIGVSLGSKDGKTLQCVRLVGARAEVRCVPMICRSRKRSVFERGIYIRGGVHITLAIGLLACFGGEVLRASTPTVPHKLTVHKSVSATSRRFAIDPKRRTPVFAQLSTGKPQHATTPVAGTRHTTGSALLLPLPDEVGLAQPQAVDTKQYPPVVTYRDGQLTIDAQNSTLAEVLKLIAEKTGATIDVPPGSGLERIVEHVGPGPTNDVLKHLLNGSPFNFIIVCSPERPQDPAQVLLSLQGVGTDTPNPAAAPEQTSTSPVLWTPRDDTSSVLVLPPQYNDSLTPPKEPLPPEARGELMREKVRELLEKTQQQYPPQ